jgi:hypothetical protein
MRFVIIRLAGVYLPLCAAGAALAVQTQDIQLRLESPLASYSKPGTSFTARVSGPASHDVAPLLPTGTLVRGAVRQAHSIGLGLRRERAGLTLEFEGCELPGGETAHCDVQLLAVDNARETVQKNNRISGMLAASHPPRFLSGLWYRPAPSILLRPVSGLMGAGGMVCNRLLPGPWSAAIFITSRLIFFRIPDPEIELPSGTDLIARVSVPDGHYSEPLFRARPAGSWPPGFVEWLNEVPRETTRADGAPMADKINISFLAGEAEVKQAFQAAGWEGADPLNARTFGKTYSAFMGMKSYPRAPVSMIHYQRRAPDLVFQKSFNTLSQRHHIRLWKTERPGGGTVWLGAATHDVGMAFDWNRMSLTHRIDLKIDRERSKVVNDLSTVGCLSGMLALQGSTPARRKPRAEEVISDGALWTAQLQPCEAHPPVALALLRPKRSRVALSTRRVVLESRYYLTRGNAYHFTYEAVRWAFFGHKQSDQPYTAILK